MLASIPLQPRSDDSQAHDVARDHLDMTCIQETSSASIQLVDVYQSDQSDQAVDDPDS